MIFERRAGLLLHPTSLPGPYGIGTLGQEAYNWVDFLSAAGMRLWQVMPLGPTGYGDSPYQCFSAFAGNPFLIDLPKLQQAGLLSQADLADALAFAEDRVQYGPVIEYKLELLARAHTNFSSADSEQRSSFATFCQNQAYWLDDYALFMALKEAHEGQPWNTWDMDIRTRKKKAITSWTKKLSDEVERQKLWQWLFYEQWQDLKNHANAKDIQIIGDIPIFIAYDSADAWANPELFYFDNEGNPEVVAGVPPDYFSETGQRWGNPLYNWDALHKNKYAWWIKRFESNLEFYDLIRVDHFRGFEAYWEIPADEPTAINGKWVKAKGKELFEAVREALGDVPIIAEDLGVITPAVEKLRDEAGFPGMKVLQFAFGGDYHEPYLPHMYIQNSVVYTGTHDNDTTRGWYAQAPENERDFVRRYLARADENIVQDLVRLAFASTANTALVPLQDVLDLGSEARMNTPGVAAGNWSWRFSWQQVPDWMAPYLRELAAIYGRLEAAESEDTAYRQSVE